MTPKIALTIFCGTVGFLIPQVSLPAAAATGYTTVNALGSLTFSSPIKLASLPGVTNQLFVVERNKGIQMVNLATMTKSTFLDLAAYLTAQGTPLATDGECGFLGLAFHPNYNQNGYLFVFYSVTISGQLHERVARFKAFGTAGNYNAATSVDTTTHTPLITQYDQATNHNGGDVNFGPDGYLYFSAGDEGNADDSFDNGRHINQSFFAGIFRLDVDLKPGSLAPNAHTQGSTSFPSAINPGTYAIPPDNPFVNLPVNGSGNSTYNGFTFPNSTVRTEFWACGFRNPFRFCFDAPTGQMFVGDVGQNLYEEVDVVTSGGFNGGWSWREGDHTHTPAQAPTAEPPGFSPNPPVFEYDHTNDGVGNDAIIYGNAVIGGMYYRGAKYGELNNSYIFGDNGSGIIAVLRPNGSGGWAGSRLTTDSQLCAFGTDPRNGDPLFCSLASNQVKTISRTGASPPTWHSAQVTALTNPSLNNMADGARTGVAHSSWNLYFYKGTDNNIWAVFLGNNQWGQQQLTTKANVSDWLAYEPTYGTLCYQGTDGNLWCVFYNASTAQWVTLQLGNPPQGVTVAGDVVVDSNGGWNNVYYRGSDSRIYAAYWSGNAWLHVGLGGTATVKGNLAVEGNNHLVYYQGTDNNIWCFYYNGKVWSQIQLTTKGNVGGSVAVDNAGLIAYYKSNADTSAWCTYSVGGPWTPLQLDTTANMSASTTSFSSIAPYNSNDCALYLDGNGQADSLSWNGSQWTHIVLGDGGSNLTGGLSLQRPQNWLFARRSDGNVIVFWYQ